MLCLYIHIYSVGIVIVTNNQHRFGVIGILHVLYEISPADDTCRYEINLTHVSYKNISFDRSYVYTNIPWTIIQHAHARFTSYQ